MRSNKTIEELCSENTNIAINIFCQRINKSNADLYLVLAQKAVCLFEILLKEGKINAEKKYKYVSNSSLGFGTEFLKGKKIAIIDDTVISGTTIASLVNELLLEYNIREENIEIIAIARDKAYQTIQFISKNGENILNCASIMNDTECIALNYDISHMIAYYGNCYDTDFPKYNEIEIDKELFKMLFKPLDWNLYEVTNDIQKEGNIEAFVLFPKAHMQNELFNTIGVDLTNLVHLKIRVYIHSYPNGKSILKLVPMALFNETPLNVIDELFKKLTTDKAFGKFNNPNTTGITKTRYLQYIIAHKLVCVFSKTCKVELFNIDKNSIAVTFGFENQNIILDCINKQYHIKSEKLYYKCTQPDMLGYNPISIKNEISTNNNYIVNELLYSAIKWLYNTKELTARKRISDFTYHYRKDFNEIKKCEFRLKGGFSLKALEKILMYCSDCCNIEYLVSLFIDRGIDEGIMVPILYNNEKNNTICRAYRHGEDLPFGEADKSRLIYFLLELGNIVSNIDISSVAFEKMIVLFYQVGLKNFNIFNRFLGFDNEQILQQRFNMHGVVAAVSDNEDAHVYLSMDGSNDGTMITKLKEFNGKFFISKIRNNKRQNKEATVISYSILIDEINDYFENSTVAVGSLSEEIKTDIKKIAKMIGTWYMIERNRNRQRFFKEDITALTSCVDIYTFSSSIATAVHYFKRFWESNNVQEDLMDLEYNRDYHFQKFEVTLHEAHKKHKFYTSKKAIEVIDYVSTIFGNFNCQNEKENWDNIWRRIKTNSIEGNPNLSNSLNDSLRYLYLYSECYSLISNKIIFKDIITEDFTFFEQYCGIENNGIIHNYYSDLKGFIQEKNIEKRVKNFGEFINNSLTDSEKTITIIEKELAENIHSYTVEYKSALVIDIYCTNKLLINRKIKDVWESIPEEKEKTFLNFIHYEKNNTCQQYIIAHRYFDYDSLESLFKIYNSIYGFCQSMALPTSTVFIPYFPQGLNLKHNLKKNIKIYAEEFNSELKTYTDEIEFNNKIHNFLILKNWISCVTEKEIFEKLNDFIEQRSFDKNRMTYYYYSKGKPKRTSIKHEINLSTVIIKDGERFLGTGFILYYSNNIYCITCKHIIKDVQDFSNLNCHNSYLSSSLSILDDLTSHNEGSVCNINNSNAENDVLICKVNLYDNCIIDYNDLFDIDDFINTNIQMNQNCQLFGFTEHNSFGVNINNLVFNGVANYGFCQLIDCDNRIKPGLSGSAILSLDKIIGIHSKQLEGNGMSYMIPIECVKMKLETLLGGENVYE